MNIFKKKIHLSLRMKWALASSLFIFVVFTFFAIFTFKSISDLYVARERSAILTSIRNAENRLSVNKENLNRATVNKSLQLTGLASDNGDKNGTLFEMNPFIAGLIQPTITFNIYDVDHKKIYTTKQNFQMTWSRVNREPEMTTVDHSDGLIVCWAVNSRKKGEPIGYVQIFDDFKSWNDLQNTLLVVLFIFEIISLLISAWSGYFLSNYFLQPLQILHETMQEISSDPKSERLMIPIKTNDELEDLANIFNEMLKRMRSYIKQQEQFVSDVSHELRTPVAIIQGQLNMLNRWGKDDPEVLDDAIKSSLQEINRMKELVSEMLELARAGQVDLHYANKTTEVRPIVEQTIDNIRLLYKEFEINLHNNIVLGIEAKVYRNHLEQMMIIILDNAIKYSTDQKVIDVTTSSTETEVKISITDHGEGMSEDELGKIFNRFYRVDKARARKKGGNGLGLAIAYQLMESYGGRIDVTSKLDQGTTFTLVFKKVTTNQN